METKTIQLSNAEVEIKQSLTWGDVQRIQNAIVSGAKMSGTAKDAENVGFDFDATKMLEAKYITLECMVVSIKEGDKEKKFTREWMDNLPVEDGDKLFEEVDAVAKKNQK